VSRANKQVRRPVAHLQVFLVTSSRPPTSSTTRASSGPSTGAATVDARASSGSPSTPAKTGRSSKASLRSFVISAIGSSCWVGCKDAARAAGSRSISRTWPSSIFAATGSGVAGSISTSPKECGRWPGWGRARAPGRDDHEHLRVACSVAYRVRPRARRPAAGTAHSHAHPDRARTTPELVLASRIALAHVRGRPDSARLDVRSCCHPGR